MDITSLIITFVGIIILLALYIISRISGSKLPQVNTTRLPVLMNEDGSRFTSILDDIPARDGSTPVPPKKIETEETAKTPPTTQENKTENVENKPNQDAKSGIQNQHILFISPKNETALNGNLVAKVLKNNGLVLGDMDIYHYFIDTQSNSENDKTSLFRVANGVAPWTLRKEDMHNKELAGLSIVLITPSAIDDSDAIKMFISISHKLSQEMNGILKNDLQKVFTPKDEARLLNLV